MAELVNSVSNEEGLLPVFLFLPFLPLLFFLPHLLRQPRLHPLPEEFFLP